MSFLDELRKAVDEEVVIIHTFLLHFEPRKNIVHAFFEGKTDESFYGTLIRRFKPDDWKLKTYICGNKNSVYYHFEKLASKSQSHQPLLFFVDKDLDDIVPYSWPVSKYVYVTGYYSIENYIVTSDSIEQVWAEMYRQSSGTDLSDQLISSFSQALIDAHQILIDIMAWVLMQRRTSNRPNLDCILTEKYLDITEDLKVVRLLSSDQMIDLLRNQTKVNTSTEKKHMIDACRVELLKFQSKQVIRGHNEIDFFILFLKKLRDIVVKAAQGKINTKVALSKANIIDILGPRVPTPESLKDFLRMHLPAKDSLV